MNWAAEQPAQNPNVAPTRRSRRVRRAFMLPHYAASEGPLWVGSGRWPERPMRYS